MTATGFSVSCTVMSQMMKPKYLPAHSLDNGTSVSVRSMLTVGGQECQKSSSHLVVHIQR